MATSVVVVLTTVGWLEADDKGAGSNNTNRTRGTYDSCWQYDAAAAAGGGGTDGGGNWLHAPLADWVSENVIQAVGRSVATQWPGPAGSSQCTLHDDDGDPPPPPPLLSPLPRSSFLVDALSVSDGSID